MPLFENKDTDTYDSLIILQQHWIIANKRKDLNSISDETARLHIIKIPNSLLKIIKEIEK
jgi:hypothetical protein